MASDGTEILIEALKAAVIGLDDARSATITLQQNIRAAERREIALNDQCDAASALIEELKERNGELQGSLDAAHRRIAEAEADRDRLRRVAELGGPMPRFDDYAAQVPR